MLYYPESISKLIEQFSKLPGIGPKTAQRLAFYILKNPKEQVYSFAQALVDVKEKIGYCSICNNITDDDPCHICNNPNRIQDLICIVEEPRDVIAMERTREFKGLYHVLHGAISPMDGIGPDQLKIKELLGRVQSAEFKEIIIATNPNVEGEATAIYLSKLLKALDIRTTRIAHGVPVGGDLEYTDEITLGKAFAGRREM